MRFVNSFWAAVLTTLLLTGGVRAQQREAPRPSLQAMAGVCAFAPMPAKRRLAACEDLLSRPDISNPVKALGNLGLAEALRQSGEPAAALDAIDLAIQLKPDFAPAYLSRGAVYLSMNDPRNAIGSASEAIDLDRRNPAGYLLRAEAYLRERQPAFALGDMDEAIQMAPGVARLHLVRAYANMALDRTKPALADARAALKIEPELVSAYLVRTSIYMKSKQFARAAADAGRAMQLAPKDRLSLDAGAVAFTEIVQFDKAKTAADALVTLQPNNADALNARCWVIALTPDPEAALPDCDAAIAADPKHFQAHDSRAFVYWQLGRLTEARADLDQANVLKPDFWDWSKREDRFITVMTRRYLKSLGDYRGPIDGDFDDDSDTPTAVRAYQEKIGMPVTGLASPPLMARLASDFAKN